LVPADQANGWPPNQTGPVPHILKPSQSFLPIHCVHWFPSLSASSVPRAPLPGPALPSDPHAHHLSLPVLTSLELPPSAATTSAVVRPPSLSPRRRAPAYATETRRRAPALPRRHRSWHPMRCVSRSSAHRRRRHLWHPLPSSHPCGTHSAPRGSLTPTPPSSAPHAACAIAWHHSCAASALSCRLLYGMLIGGLLDS
jgi:hypothetical protein